jgi:phosphohistidine phosphatase
MASGVFQYARMILRAANRAHGRERHSVRPGELQNTMEIYILRHGIAEDAKGAMTDAERALTDEGRQKLRDLLRVARAAKAHPSLILTSPLRRAVETAEIAADALGCGRKPIRTEALAPESTPGKVWQEILGHRDAGGVLLAGHEPLLSQTIAHLLACPALNVDFKKGALARIDIDRFGEEPRGILKWLLTSKLAG